MPGDPPLTPTGLAAWEAGATPHAALTQHPHHPDHAQDEDDDQDDGLLGDVPSRVRRRAAGITLENLQQALYTALDRAGLYALTDADHQAVRDLTHHLDPDMLRQVVSWLERTRTAALALRGEQVPPTRPRVRRNRF
ncbi:hypothetical protein ACFXPX_27055 [Kitasatospora sp. NPDC059146]|uniref:hypothetical protein n=1 Tax=Kitasatospora sp. NPDC059146 TaxID=3346741 RepID=UPI0036C6A3A9